MQSSNWLTMDPILGKWVPQISPFFFESTQDVFHDLIGCVVEQQIHYRSTKNIYKRLLEKAQLDRVSVENFSVLEEKSLQFLKISQRKYETLSAICEFFSANFPVWTDLSDDEVRALLKTIPGVGPWTQEMILLFTLERKNAFPVEDYHLQQSMIQLYGLDPNNQLKKRMKEIAETWEGNTSLACLYLWELRRLKILT